MTRLPDPDPAALDPDVREFLTALPPDPMVKMLTHSAGTVKPFIQMAKTLFTQLRLPARARELVILTVAEYTGAAFVTAQHRPMALAAGVDEPTQRLIAERRLTDPALTAEDSALLRFTAAVVQQPRVDDALFDQARAHLSDRELVEVLQIAGYYWTFGRVSTQLDVPITEIYDEPVLNTASAP